MSLKPVHNTEGLQVKDDHGQNAPVHVTILVSSIDMRSYLLYKLLKDYHQICTLCPCIIFQSIYKYPYIIHCEKNYSF